MAKKLILKDNKLIMPFTEKQIKQYLSSGGIYCIFCKSENIYSGNVSNESDRCLVTCNNCQEEWLDVHALVGVEPYDKP